MKRILIGATLIVAGVIGVAGASPVSADDHDDVPVQVVDKVCDPQDSHIGGGNRTSIPVTAPDGKLISGYCVKAGSIQQGLGPEYKYFDPPVKSYTITYTKSETIKEISHYVVFYVNGAEPAKPSATPPTCDAAGTVVVPPNTDAYTYDDMTTNGATTVTVTPNEGYVLIGDTGPWGPYPIDQLTGDECEDEPVVESEPPATPPAAVVPPSAPADRPPVLTEAVASAGPAPAQAAPAQAAPTQLPATGTASWALALIAMGLVLLGSGFVSFGRRLS